MKLFIFFVLFTGPLMARSAEWAADYLGKLRPIRLFPVILFKCTTVDNELVRISYYKGKYQYWFGKDNKPKLKFSSTPVEILLRKQGEYWRKSGINSGYYDPFPFFYGAYIYDVRTEPLIDYGVYRGSNTSVYIFKNNKNDHWYEEIDSIKCKEDTVIINWITNDIPPAHKLYKNQLFEDGLFKNARQYFE